MPQLIAHGRYPHPRLGAEYLPLTAEWARTFRKAGMEVPVDEGLLEKAKATGLYKTSRDVKAAVKDCDIVYTDTWVDMEFFLDPKFRAEKERRIKLMLPYQINKKLLGSSDALIMHDMPIHRGYEIADNMVENPNSIIYDQSENRLHSAKAILTKLLK